MCACAGWCARVVVWVCALACARVPVRVQLRGRQKRRVGRARSHHRDAPTRRNERNPGYTLRADRTGSPAGLLYASNTPVLFYCDWGWLGYGRVHSPSQ